LSKDYISKCKALRQSGTVGQNIIINAHENIFSILNLNKLDKIKIDVFCR